KKLERQPDMRFGSQSGNAQATIAVDASQKFQPIRGVGAAFTDSSLWLLSKLSADRREQTLRSLLDPSAGIGLSVMRVPMAASDFSASGMYSYDDLPAGQSDPTLAHFSIVHDNAYVLPILREALRINPSLKIVASPWSPPAWMKTNDSMVGVSPAGGPGTLRPDAYAPLARYFVRFIEAYRDAGVPIWAVTPQNEPLQPTADYPGMFLSASQEATFVQQYLAPAIRAAGLDTRIYGYDYVWLGSEPYAAGLMAGASAENLDGIAYHCYFGAPESMSAVHSLYPKADLIEDECSTGISVLSPIQVLLRSVNNWASTVLMWNVSLDPSGGPKMGSGCFNCIGVTTIDPTADRVAYTGNSYELGHVGKFVQRGARRVGATVSPDPGTCGNSPVCGLEASAFENPDGSTVLVVTNSGPETAFEVRRPDGQGFSYSLPAQQPPPDGTDNSADAAVVTFVWHAASTAGSRGRAGHARRARHRRIHVRHHRPARRHAAK
ncbi:MAG: glycoside hydrolase family 30 protein, partial [Thermoleophilaceae bacterium]